MQGIRFSKLFVVFYLHLFTILGLKGRSVALLSIEFLELLLQFSLRIIRVSFAFALFALLFACFALKLLLGKDLVACFDFTTFSFSAS